VVPKKQTTPDYCAEIITEDFKNTKKMYFPAKS
jgi:hypothetical protein